MAKMLAAGLIGMIGACGLGLGANEPTGNHDLQYQVMHSQLRAYEQQEKVTEAAFRKDFELKFNRLVKAAEDFSKAYNGQSGRVWPHDKAEALRHAMAALQKQSQFR